MSNSSNSKKLLIGTAIYAVGTFGTKILMFLIAPLYTYYLATEEMGTYDVLMSTIGLLIPIITLQISDAVYRWIIRDNNDSSMYLKITYQFLIISCLASFVLILIIDYFLISIPYLVYFLCALFSAILFQTTQKILRGLKRQWLFAISGIIYTVIFLVLNVVQLCVLHKGIESLLMSYIVANLIGFASIIIIEKKIRINIWGKIEFNKLKELLRYSIPLIPNYLSWWIVDSSDRYIVLWLLGVSSNGVLAISHKFPTVLQSVFGLFLNSWQDLAIASDKDESSFFSNVFKKLYRISFTSLWVVIPLTKLFVLLIMGKDYKVACNYIPFYYLGAVFQAFCSFYGVGYLRSKNTKASFSSSVYGALINAAVNIGLIKVIGLHAAAISTFISFLVMWLIRERQNRDELGIQIKWLDFCVLLVVNIIICVISIIGNRVINTVLVLIGIICFMLFNYKEVKDVLLVISRRGHQN